MPGWRNLVDARDLKSLGVFPRAGSSPASGTPSANGALMKRKSNYKRETYETSIEIQLIIDGKGNSEIDTPVGFLNHMLEQLARHGKFDIQLNADGDTHIDYHHIVEDIGICLGKAFYDACDNFKGIKRFSSYTIPMDDALSSVAIDISNRPYLVFNVKNLVDKIGDFDTQLIEEFFRAFSSNFRCNLHINNHYGYNSHHIVESIFKAFALSLNDALEIIDLSIPSTKGVL